MSSITRSRGIVGDALSVFGLLLIAFSVFIVWQEGFTALFVTLNPNPAGYSRHVGSMPSAADPRRQALLAQLYPRTPTPIPPATETPVPEAPDEPLADAPQPAEVAPAPQAPTPTPTPAPGSEPPKRLIVPSLGIDTEVVPVGFKLVDENGELTREWETADYAAGYHEGSANPGENGNLVISGHNNIRGRVFRLLERAKPGDAIYVDTASGRRYVYMVREQVIVPEAGVSDAKHRENARYLAQSDDARLTLVSCWPYWTNTHRVIVVAEFIGMA
ncbi:MAG: sortase [Anaerolineae bacterium]